MMDERRRELLRASAEEAARQAALDVDECDEEALERQLWLCRRLGVRWPNARQWSDFRCIYGLRIAAGVSVGLCVIGGMTLLQLAALASRFCETC